jgi:hypothetical protein
LKVQPLTRGVGRDDETDLTLFHGLFDRFALDRVEGLVPIQAAFADTCIYRDDFVGKTPQPSRRPPRSGRRDMKAEP